MAGRKIGDRNVQHFKALREECAFQIHTEAGAILHENQRRPVTVALVAILNRNRRLPLSPPSCCFRKRFGNRCQICSDHGRTNRDRKSTRLNSSHSQISYAVFCLKKKKRKTYTEHTKHRPYRV